MLAVPREALELELELVPVPVPVPEPELEQVLEQAPAQETVLN